MKYYVAGHQGMVCSAIYAKLVAAGCHVIKKPRRDLDLTDRSAVNAVFKTERPDCVVIAAAKFGGAIFPSGSIM